MPKPARPSAPRSRTLESRSLEHGELAAASRERKPGFTFSERDDALFALGYPHVTLLYDDESAPEAAAERLLLEGYPYRDVEFPRDAIARVARALPGGPAVDIRADGTAALNEKGKRAVATGGPLTIDDLQGALAGMLAVPSPSTDFILLVHEAFLGPEAVVSAVIDALSSTPVEKFWRRPRDPQFQTPQEAFLHNRTNAARWLDTTALMLLRLPTSRAAPLRARLVDWASAGGLDAQGRAEAGVNALLGEPIVAPPRPVVAAPSSLVVSARRAAAKQPWSTLPDPRLVYLGGDEVYAIELELWAKYGPPYSKPAAHHLILQQFGKIRSTLTVDLALRMATKSSAKAAAQAWLVEHASFASARLKSLASGGEHADAARAVLAKLPS